MRNKCTGDSRQLFRNCCETQLKPKLSYLVDMGFNTCHVQTYVETRTTDQNGSALRVRIIRHFLRHGFHCSVYSLWISMKTLLSCTLITNHSFPPGFLIRWMQ